jgi:hypothetical protein
VADESGRAFRRRPAERGRFWSLRETLRPTLAKLEAMRRWTLGAMLVASLAVLGALGVLAIWLYRGSHGELWPPIMVALAAGLPAMLIASLHDRYRSRFRALLVQPLVTGFDSRLTYRPEDRIAKRLFPAPGLFARRIPLGVAFRDLVEGELGATRIRFCHALIDDAGERFRQGAVFRGLLLDADFNKHFHGSTYVLPDRAQRLLGGVGQALQGLDDTYGSLVKLEDPEFERLFVVYASDQVEARYILSSALMQRIVDFRRRSGHAMRFGFVGSHLYLAIERRRGLFEPPVLARLDDAVIHEFWHDLELFTGIVEDLNLNTRIWTKR